MDDDEQFMKRLQELTCDIVDWSGFDPSKWRDEDPNDWHVSDDGQGYGDGWSSDGSQRIPFKTTTSTSPRNAGIAPLRMEDITGEQEEYRDASDLENIKWPEVSVKQGEIDPITELFTPWRMVLEYPNLFVGKRNGGRVSQIRVS